MQSKHITRLIRIGLWNFCEPGRGVGQEGHKPRKCGPVAFHRVKTNRDHPSAHRFGGKHQSPAGSTHQLGYPPGAFPRWGIQDFQPTHPYASHHGMQRFRGHHHGGCGLFVDLTNTQTTGNTTQHQMSAFGQDGVSEGLRGPHGEVVPRLKCFGGIHHIKRCWIQGLQSKPNQIRNRGDGLNTQWVRGGKLKPDHVVRGVGIGDQKFNLNIRPGIQREWTKNQIQTGEGLVVGTFGGRNGPGGHHRTIHPQDQFTVWHVALCHQTDQHANLARIPHIAVCGDHRKRPVLWVGRTNPVVHQRFSSFEKPIGQIRNPAIADALDHRRTTNRPR